MRTAIVAIFAIVAVGSIASPAYATSYPSWQDVQNAKASQSATAAQVSRINSLIAQLKAQVAQTQADLKKRGEELQVAEANLDDAIIKAQLIQAQADASKAKADAATTQAGRLAAQLYRTGGSDLTASLFLSGNGATKTSPEQLLSDLGSMTQARRTLERHLRAGEGEPEHRESPGRERCCRACGARQAPRRSPSPLRRPLRQRPWLRRTSWPSSRSRSSS